VSLVLAYEKPVPVAVADIITVVPEMPANEITAVWNGAGSPTDAGGVSEDGTADWLVGVTPYDEFRDIVNGLTEDTTINLAAGAYTIANNTYTGAYLCGIRGAVDGNGLPATEITVLTGNFQLVGAIPKTSYGVAGFHCENIKFGPNDNTIAAHNFGTTALTSLLVGSEAFKVTRPSKLILANCEIRFSNYAGILYTAQYEFFNDAGTERGSREVGLVGLYNSYFYGLGKNQGTHNVYIIGPKTIISRCVLHTPSGSHCLKHFGEDLLLYDSEFDNALDASIQDNGVQVIGDSPLNLDHPETVVIERCRLSVRATATTANNIIEWTSRRASLGCGWSNQYPSWHLMDDGDVNVDGAGTGYRFLQWENSAQTGAPSETYGFRADGAYTSGTSLGVKNFGYITGSDAGAATMSDTGTNVWKLKARTSAGIEFRTFTISGTINQNGSSTLTLSSGLSGTLANSDPIICWRDSAGPDVAKLNPVMFDQNDANYFWDRIKTAGVYDIDKGASASNVHFINDTMLRIVNNFGASAKAINWITELGGVRFSAYNAEMIGVPLAPADSPESTPAWSDVANTALFDFADTSGDLLTGREGTGSDIVWPFADVFTNGLLYATGTGMTNEAGATRPNEDIQSDTLDLNVYTVEGGVATKVATPTSGSIFKGQGTTMAAAALETDTTIEVVSVSGMSVGDRLLVQYPYRAGSKSIHSTTIASIASPNITMDDALERDVNNGADVIFNADAGNPPSFHKTAQALYDERFV
jgi:hypothetical protein